MGLWSHTHKREQKHDHDKCTQHDNKAVCHAWIVLLNIAAWGQLDAMTQDRCPAHRAIGQDAKVSPMLAPPGLEADGMEVAMPTHQRKVVVLNGIKAYDACCCCCCCQAAGHAGCSSCGCWGIEMTASGSSTMLFVCLASLRAAGSAASSCCFALYHCSAVTR